jgi:NH3-dependent NAD+ synthetase
MAELTIQVPDELAQRLEPFRDRLPELLTRAVEAILPSTPSADLLPSVANPTDAPIAYAELLDFLITQPTPEEIIAFKVSAEAQERIRTLLDKNREGTLSETETAELDLYEQLEHMMILLKAKAHALTDK